MNIEKTEYSYLVTDCDLKFGEQITLGEELLIPASVLDNIKSEIEYLPIPYTTIRLVGDIIDKFNPERKEVETVSIPNKITNRDMIKTLFPIDGQR